MKKIKIFFAPSEAEMKSDRIEVETFIRRLNDCYIEKGIYFTLPMCEEAGNTDSGDGRQGENGSAFFDSDLILFLFFMETEKETLEYFDAAEANFKRNNKPRIITYFKTAVDRPQTEAIERFKKRLSQGTEYYYNTYEHIDTLKLGILMQIKQLDLAGVDIHLEGGKAWQGGVALLSLDHVEMVSGYEELQRLKTERTELEDRFYTAKTKYAESLGDSAAYEAFYEAAKQRNEAVQEIRDIETRLYHMIEGMYEQTSQGKLSKRQVEGYRLVERGRFREAQVVLDFDGIVSESRHDEALADQVDKRAQVHVNEQLQLVGVNETLGDWPGVDACYREAVRLEERHSLPRKAMLAFVKFLHTQNRYAEGIAAAEKLRYFYQNPDNRVPDEEKWHLYNLLGRMYIDTQRTADADEILNSALAALTERAGRGTADDRSHLANIYNQLGILYSDTQRLDEAEAMYEAALEIQVKLSAENPDKYGLQLSSIFNNLGDLYREKQRMSEAEEMNLSALKIRKEQYAISPDSAGPLLADTYNNLGALFDETGRFTEAEAMFQTALEIKTKLVSQNPEGFEPTLASAYYNLGQLYWLTKRYGESEGMHKHALEIRKRLVSRNPEVFERSLSNSYHYLGVVYLSTRRFAEAEAALITALNIRSMLAARNPDANEEFVADSYRDLGTLYMESGRFAEAEAMINAAQELLIKLAARNPDVYEMDLADVCLNQGNFYTAAKRIPQAGEAYRTALQLYEKYAETNPRCAEQSVEAREALESLRDAQNSDGSLGQVGRDALFTPEEKEVAILLTDGDTTRDISRKLSLPAAEVSRLVRAVRAKIVSTGEPDPKMAAVVVAYRLSKREAHILRCLCQGMTNAEIAAEMVIAEETVRFHTHKLFKKLPAESRRNVAEWVGEFGEATD